MANISLEWLTSLLFIYSLMWKKSDSKANLYSFLVDHPHSKLFIELLKLASTKAEEYPGRDASDFMMAEEVVDLTVGTHVCTFGLFNLSFDIFLFLVQIIYDFSGLFIREIFLIAWCLMWIVEHSRGPSTKINIFTWFWPSFPKFVWGLKLFLL